MPCVFTIGHSNHSLEAFLALLSRHRITAVGDVRSAPYSRYNPHFSREPLAAALRAERLHYVYLGRELGGRSDDPDCYENGRIRYDRVARTERFGRGLARVTQGAAKHRIALMCAEKDPLNCHRTLLVGQALDAQGVLVKHILADGALETHADAMDRMLKAEGLRPEDDLFRRGEPRAQSVAEAITRRTA